MTYAVTHKFQQFIQTHITSSWFFGDVPNYLKILGIYVKGDALILVPVLIAISLCFNISVPFGLLVISVYVTVRGIGEMGYWLLQQFGPKTYRPFDYGLKKLNNDGIYIIYQLRALVSILLGTSLFLYVLLYY